MQRFVDPNDNSNLVPALSTPDLKNAVETRSSNDYNITSATTTTFIGTAEADNTVEVFANAISLGTTTANVKGKWSFTVPESAAFSDSTISISASASGPVRVLKTTPIPKSLVGRTVHERGNSISFAALKDDGSVITWGNFNKNWGGDTSDVSSELTSGVSQIYFNGTAYAALKKDGSVVTWGSEVSGDSSSVSSKLKSGVTQTEKAFAALKNDGSVVTWGNSAFDGDSSKVASQIQSSASQVISNRYSFAALKDDGSVVIWGISGNSIDFDSVKDDLQSGVVSFANSFQNDHLVTDIHISASSSALDLTVDTISPEFTSGDSAAAIDENSGTGQIIYTAIATDNTSVNYSLKANNTRTLPPSSSTEPLGGSASPLILTMKQNLPNPSPSVLPKQPAIFMSNPSIWLLMTLPSCLSFNQSIL